LLPTALAADNAPMDTPIGRSLNAGSVDAWITTAIALAVVSCDLVLCGSRQFTTSWRFALAIAAVAPSALLAARRRDPASFGFRLSPLQSWAYWARVTIYLGALLLIVLLAAAAIAIGVLHLSVPRGYIGHPSQIGQLFIWMCVYAPLSEEAVYRLAICPAAIAWFGPKTAIAVSGVAFALAHVLGGNASPENQIAGFLLAWSFLRSGSIAVPIALHFLGNLCAFSWHVILFYWAQ
jgi:membrane protease YdiL (CAAX protease family)